MLQRSIKSLWQVTRDMLQRSIKSVWVVTRDMLQRSIKSVWVVTRDMLQRTPCPPPTPLPNPTRFPKKITLSFVHSFQLACTTSNWRAQLLTDGLTKFETYALVTPQKLDGCVWRWPWRWVWRIRVSWRWVWRKGRRWSWRSVTSVRQGVRHDKIRLIVLK